MELQIKYLLLGIQHYQRNATALIFCGFFCALLYSNDTRTRCRDYRNCLNTIALVGLDNGNLRHRVLSFSLKYPIIPMQPSHNPQVRNTLPIPQKLQFEINEYFTWYDAQSTEDILFDMMEKAMINPEFELSQDHITKYLFFYGLTKQLIRQLQPFTTVFH